MRSIVSWIWNLVVLYSWACIYTELYYIIISMNMELQEVKV